MTTTYEVTMPTTYRGFTVEWDESEFVGSGTTEAMTDADASVSDYSVEAVRAKIDKWWDDAEAEYGVCGGCSGTGNSSHPDYPVRCTGCDGSGESLMWQEIEPLSRSKS
jgi:hypothetical protein